LQDPISKNPITKRGWRDGGVVQGESPEFKPQNLKNKTKQKRNTKINYLRINDPNNKWAN
jgi:hypothetical protein